MLCNERLILYILVTILTFISSYNFLRAEGVMDYNYIAVLLTLRNKGSEYFFHQWSFYKYSITAGAPADITKTNLKTITVCIHKIVWGSLLSSSKMNIQLCPKSIENT